ncbi:hypothetical protein DM868_00045 [Natronomonas salsuginis]|uniref:HTH dtxR-type domain-containing protein n=1 Tax=Natronomonas salsuginis TaxID=2217661 RepID=A0A4U5JGJ2_9EURY|nr:hypothetical protein DM868_00045 [Natronomonas salsuginis]
MNRDPRRRGSRIADAVGKPPSATTEMVQRLESRGLLTYEPYAGRRSPRRDVRRPRSWLTRTRRSCGSFETCWSSKLPTARRWRLRGTSARRSPTGSPYRCSIRPRELMPF